MANDRDELMRLADILRVNIEDPIGADEEEGDPGFICIGVDDAKLIKNALRTLAQRHTEQCCTCGKRFDAREQSEGGAGEGAELTDGRWTCSADCWELATEQRAPQNGAVPKGMLDLVEALDAAMVESLMGEGADIWKGNRGKLRNRLPENVGAILAKMRALLAAAPAPEADNRTAIAWRSDTKYGVGYSFANEFFDAFPTFPNPPEAERAKGDALGAAVLAIVDGVMSQREEVLRAFVAKHGFQPDEAVQVTHGNRWWIERRGHPAGQPEGVEALIRMIADDGYACTFQSMGQYRTALLREARRLASAQRAGKEVPHA